MTSWDLATRAFTVTVAGLSLGTFLIAVVELSADRRSAHLGLYDRLGGGLLGGVYVTAVLLPIVLAAGGLAAAATAFVHHRRNR